jgi:hypothetical protein
MSPCLMCKLPTSRDDGLCSPCRMGSVASEHVPRSSEALPRRVWQRCTLPLNALREDVCDKPLTRCADGSWRCEDDHYNPESSLVREALGRLVREVWVVWAKDQPNPKPHHLAPWDALAEPDREVDRRIGETLLGIRDWRTGQTPGNRAGANAPSPKERSAEATVATWTCAYCRATVAATQQPNAFAAPACGKGSAAHSWRRDPSGLHASRLGTPHEHYLTRTKTRHGWAVREGVNVVECPGCGFTMGLEHEDENDAGTEARYSCPVCMHGHPDAQRRESAQTKSEATPPLDGWETIRRTYANGVILAARELVQNWDGPGDTTVGDVEAVRSAVAQLDEAFPPPRGALARKKLRIENRIEEQGEVAYLAWCSAEKRTPKEWKELPARARKTWERVGIAIHNTIEDRRPNITEIVEAARAVLGCCDCVDMKDLRAAIEVVDLYECATCSAKSGAPTLCDACLARRKKAGRAWMGPREAADSSGQGSE